MPTFSPAFIFILPVTFAICVLFIIIALFKDAKTYGKSQTMLNLFLSVISLLATIAVSGSLVFLSYVGLRTWVFTDALDLAYPYRTSSPPGLYYYSDPGYVNSISGTQCNEQTTSCPLTENEKTSIEQWNEQYNEWKQSSSKELIFYNRRDLVNALSILLISLPILAASILLMNRSQKQMQGKSDIRSLYFYSLSFIGLAACAIAGGILLNIALKSFLLPKEAKIDNYGGIMRVVPLSFDETGAENTNINNLASCVSACDFLEPYVENIKGWKSDQQASQNRAQSLNPYHDEYATSIPIIIIGGALFAYHFLTIRKEAKKEEKEEAR